MLVKSEGNDVCKSLFKKIQISLDLIFANFANLISNNFCSKL